MCIIILECRHACTLTIGPLQAGLPHLHKMKLISFYEDATKKFNFCASGKSLGLHEAKHMIQQTYHDHTALLWSIVSNKW